MTRKNTVGKGVVTHTMAQDLFDIRCRTGKNESRHLSLLAHHLGDRMSNNGAGLFDFLFGKSRSNTDLQRRKNRLLWRQVVWKRLEASDEYSVCKTLYPAISVYPKKNFYHELLEKSSPHPQCLATGTADLQTRAVSRRRLPA